MIWIAIYVLGSIFVSFGLGVGDARSGYEEEHKPVIVILWPVLLLIGILIIPFVISYKLGLRLFSRPKREKEE